jgi:hypothetical protein
MMVKVPLYVPAEADESDVAGKVTIKLAVVDGPVEQVWFWAFVVWPPSKAPAFRAVPLDWPA